jgi:hypothetical protein
MGILFEMTVPRKMLGRADNSSAAMGSDKTPPERYDFPGIIGDAAPIPRGISPVSGKGYVKKRREIYVRSGLSEQFHMGFKIGFETLTQFSVTQEARIVPG